ncbi:carboxylic acid transmembrane transporter [Schizosaccharomyces osmophilus]|uniref:Carboxylic acid transmembrane transporter n=1 Tax=Schizosaccharomyces osmophilus TaxID=2545709 RepID=A0AAE9W6S1_9SCHI|nr:carboxylic acid transmembrane transporter [Schizosaccharomyces osmophilus]WBW70633.1 carboxylic acid transmembrane transporter [Schizosaccharomyces osmophilus]
MDRSVSSVLEKSIALDEKSDKINGDQRVSVDLGESEEAAEVYVIDHKAERKLCRKLDIRILPLLALLYLFNALDKSNVSNAKTNGIDKDLGFKGDEYNIMISIFYIPFVLCAFPFSYLYKRFGAARMLPLFMLSFGVMSLCQAAVKNFAGMMTVRWFLGMAESAVLPGVVYYLTTFYRRTELARRLAIFYAAANISSAFGGLLAYGVFHIKSGKLKGWQYLFLIEGSSTFLSAALIFLLLPVSVEKAHFLTDEDKFLARMRIDNDSSSAITEKLTFKQSLSVFNNPIAILWLLEEMALGVPLNSINNWLPQIVGAMGFSSVNTNLMTVAPAISGAVWLLVFAFVSDYLENRGIILIIAISTTMVGFIVYGSIDILNHIGISYFACFLMTAGAAASSVLTSTWYNNNIPNEGRRAAFTSVGVPLANAMGLVSSNIFRPKDAPKYVLALGITAGFGGLGILLVASINLYMLYDNNRRNKIQGRKKTFADVSTKELGEGPVNPNFRWFY